MNFFVFILLVRWTVCVIVVDSTRELLGGDWRCALLVLNSKDRLVRERRAAVYVPRSISLFFHSKLAANGLYEYSATTVTSEVDVAAGIAIQLNVP